MTTERLSILAAAAALREFTAPELTAYTGANPNTVRQVLHREQRERGLFERREPSRQRGKGGRAVLWRLKDVDAVLDEVEREESEIAVLRSSTGSGPPHSGTASGSGDQTDALLASAEDAVVRAYEGEDRAEQEAFAHVALNLLHAADPDRSESDDEALDVGWWERRPGSEDEAWSEIESFTVLPFGTDVSPVAEGTARELASQRARRVAAFASLATRRAEGLPVETEQLKQACQAIAAGSRTLPLDETLGWLRRIVSVSIDKSGHPPVAVLTGSKQSPSDLFPAVHSEWHRINVPAHFAHTHNKLWVEDWAEPLLASNIIPGLVMSHDNTPESNEVLNRLLRDAEHSSRAPALIIASTAEDLRIVAKVSLAGGTFYPLGEAQEGLLQVVNRAVDQLVGVRSDLLPSLALEEPKAALGARGKGRKDTRKARAQVMNRLKRGTTTLPGVLREGQAYDVIGEMKVSALLESMPGIGKVRTKKIMGQLGIAGARRVRDLATNQRLALQRAGSMKDDTEARRKRDQVMNGLRRGSTTLAQVLREGQADDVIGEMKVSALLESMPGIGKVRTKKIMGQVGIARTRRVRDLATNQRLALQRAGSMKNPVKVARTARRS